MVVVDCIDLTEEVSKESFSHSVNTREEDEECVIVKERSDTKSSPASKRKRIRLTSGNTLSTSTTTTNNNNASMSVVIDESRTEVKQVTTSVASTSSGGHNSKGGQRRKKNRKPNVDFKLDCLHLYKPEEYVKQSKNLISEWEEWELNCKAYVDAILLKYKEVVEKSYESTVRMSEKDIENLEFAWISALKDLKHGLAEAAVKQIRKDSNGYSCMYNQEIDQEKWNLLEKLIEKGYMVLHRDCLRPIEESSSNMAKVNERLKRRRAQTQNEKEDPENMFTSEQLYHFINKFGPSDGLKKYKEWKEYHSFAIAVQVMADIPLMSSQ